MREHLGGRVRRPPREVASIRSRRAAASNGHVAGPRCPTELLRTALQYRGARSTADLAPACVGVQQPTFGTRALARHRSRSRRDWNAMASPNLTRIDAKWRAALLDVAVYAVELDLTDGSGAPGEATYATTTTVRFACRALGAGCWIDFVGAGVRSAVLNGRELDVSGYREDEGIVLPELAADNELTVVATGRYSHTGEGLHRFVDPVDGAVYLYTQFETADAKRMFACFDQPDLKAEFTFDVLAPDGWVVLTNSPDVTKEPAVGGAIRHRFTPTVRMS